MRQPGKSRGCSTTPPSGRRPTISWSTPRCPWPGWTEAVWTATARACRRERIVFVILDGSSLTLTDRKRTKGFGRIGHSFGRRESPLSARGLKVITSYALDSWGVPIGILDQRWWVRGEARVRRTSLRRPADRESAQWGRAVTAISERLTRHAPDTRVHFLIDREGDASQLLEQLHHAGHAFTIRSNATRVVPRGTAREPIRAWTKRTSHLATLVEFFHDTPLDQIANALIDDYKRKRREDGLRSVSINNELRILRKILLFARDERGISLAPPRIKFLPEAERRPKIWSDVEVLRLFDACAKVAPALLPILVCLANTGMRRGEARALKWERVDLERRIIMIWPSDADEDEDEAWEPKNRRPCEVPISDALLPWLSGDRASPVWVFPAPRTGKRYAVWPENQFQRVQRTAGVLGHSHTRVTELYAHLLPNHLEAARNAVSFVPTVGPAIVAAKRRWRGKADVITDEGAHRSRKRVR